MKRIMTMVFALALLLEGCGQIDEEPGTTSSDTDLRSGVADSKAVSEIMVREMGGEEGVTNEWHIFQSEEYNAVTKTDLAYPDLPDTYHISDDDYKEIIVLDFSDYIGKNDDHYEDAFDWLNCYVEISYDNGTTDISEVYIPELWKKLHGIVYKYDPIETDLSASSDGNDDAPVIERRAVLDYEDKDLYDHEATEDMGDAYYKEVSEDDVIFDEEYGIKYARNQLLISVFPDTERSEVAEMLSTDDYGEVHIVGEIALTGDYQVEFSEDHSLSEMQEIGDYYMVFPFVENVTLNIISETAPAESDGTEVKDGWTAKLNGGVGEMMYHTYVYKTQNGYEYINTTSVTEHWGSPNWIETVAESGTVSAKRDIVEIAKQHGSADFVLFPNDHEIYEISDFLSMD